MPRHIATLALFALFALFTLGCGLPSSARASSTTIPSSNPNPSRASWDIAFKGIDGGLWQATACYTGTIDLLFFLQGDAASPTTMVPLQQWDGKGKTCVMVMFSEQAKDIFLMYEAEGSGEYIYIDIQATFKGWRGPGKP